MEKPESYKIEDLNFAVEKYYNKITENKFPVENPTGYLLGGQGGSGKSILHDIIKRNNPNVVIINGDDYRETHPNFIKINELYGDNAANYTQSFSNAVTNALIEKLSNDRYDLVIEGTCRRSDVPLKTCKDLKEKGYSVELVVMCTNKDVSWQSTIDRFDLMVIQGKTPRAVPRDKYDETVRALPNNIDELYNTGAFDEITLFNRNRDCLYRMSETPKLSPGTIVYDVLNNCGSSYRAAYEEGFAQAEKKFKKQAEKAYEQGRQESRQEIYADLNSMSTDELLKFFGRDASEITQSNGNSNNNNDGRGGRR